MKILCLADLHIGETQLQNTLSGALTSHLQGIKEFNFSEIQTLLLLDLHC